MTDSADATGEFAKQPPAGGGGGGGGGVQLMLIEPILQMWEKSIEGQGQTASTL